MGTGHVLPDRLVRARLKAKRQHAAGPGFVWHPRPCPMVRPLGPVAFMGPSANSVRVRQNLSRWRGCPRGVHVMARAPLAVAAVEASVAPSSGAAIVEDKWIARVLAAFAKVQQSSDPPPSLQRMRMDCQEALSAQRMPTTRNEEYRFTDLTSILQTQPQAPTGNPSAGLLEVLEERTLGDPAAVRVVVVDGVVDVNNSDLGEGKLPGSCYLGPLSGAPGAVGEELGRQARVRGSPFAVINGATATDAVVLFVPADQCISAPIHLLYVSACSGASPGELAVSSPRALLLLETGAQATVVEEYVNPANLTGTTFCNSVTEIVLGEKARLQHGYAALEGVEAINMKATLVEQSAQSMYSLTEARLGGSLTRQDVSVLQVGPETETEMGSFLLAGSQQLHDLHTKLRLDFPGGVANQLHKCIVAASSGRGVFDGNVKVERRAQKTDAQQLSRNLLLAPRATVNVKPNLQIVADDVKCTHGCAVSDLEEDQLFYFRARGIDAAAARKVLVYSFGKEVVNRLPFKALRERIERAVNDSLAAVVLDAQP